MGFNIKRRKLIKKIFGILATVASFFFLYRFLSFKRHKKIKKIVLQKRLISPNSAVVYPEKRLAILNIKGRLFALDLTCTHLGCTVNINQKEIVCPCHGSVFSHSGKLIKGPAKKDLRSYKVIEHGNFFVIEV